MSIEIRRFTVTGLHAFESYLAALRSNPELPPPASLLTNDDYSEPLDESATLELQTFSDQYEFGVYLVGALSQLSSGQISRDSLLWSWLALLFFDTICPPSDVGRSVLEDAAYVMAIDTNHQRYYRHLVRTPWAAVGSHSENAKVLLKTRSQTAKRSDIFEQLASRQEIFGNPTIIEAAYRMYFDASDNFPKRGAGGKLGGSARRLASVVQQLDLTYDLYDCSADKLLGLLPREFDRWKSPTQPSPSTS